MLTISAVTACALVARHSGLPQTATFVVYVHDDDLGGVASEGGAVSVVDLAIFSLDLQLMKRLLFASFVGRVDNTFFKTREVLAMFQYFRH